MTLTGSRRSIEIMLLLTIAWAGALVLWAGQQQHGYVFHRIAGDPVRYWQFHLRAGGGLTDLIGVVALTVSIGALSRGTERAVTYATAGFLALSALCWFELRFFEETRLMFHDVYDSRMLERRWPARLLHDAAWVIAWSSLLVTPALAVLRLLERRTRRRAEPPAATARRR
ncbi:MAG: hypothetical protein K8M05_08525 [Deltaproteobacteria bacterium]|nr:hypothetical protein [Kofleriaceae bacterium]